MRVLTVRQPWAWAIIHGGKDVENRTRNIAGDYRGPVAIHAGKEWAIQGAHSPAVARAYFDYRERTGWRVAEPIDQAVASFAKRGMDRRTINAPFFGAVIGVANLWAVHKADRIRPFGRFICCPNDDSQQWAMDGHYHLCLSNPRPIDPIPAKGRLGLWRPDPELQAQIEAALS